MNEDLEDLKDRMTWLEIRMDRLEEETENERERRVCVRQQDKSVVG